MRSASIIAGLVFLAASASAATAFPGVGGQPCDEKPPAWAQQPVADTVWVYSVPSDQLTAKCNKQPGPIMFGCAFRANARHPAIILLNAGLTEKERVCTLLYEQAHLPPNNWIDPLDEARAVDLPGITPPAQVPGLVHASHE